MNSQLKDKLIMKFQSFHFIAFHGKPFKPYKDFTKFEKEPRNIKLGDGFFRNTACCEIIQYLSPNIKSPS